MSRKYKFEEIIGKMQEFELGIRIKSTNGSIYELKIEEHGQRKFSRIEGTKLRFLTYDNIGKEFEILKNDIKEKNTNNIKEIKICFENCEVCTLKPDMFKYLIIEDITINKRINCYQYENGEMEEFKRCNYFSIEINKLGLSQQCWITNLKERLQSCDITGIIIIYDDYEEEIYVQWAEGNEYFNKYQNNEINDENATIIIEKKENI